MWYNVSNGDDMFFLFFFLHISNHFTTLAVNSYETISCELSGENKNQHYFFSQNVNIKHSSTIQTAIFFPKRPTLMS